jgi:hypothetical protein
MTSFEKRRVAQCSWMIPKLVCIQIGQLRIPKTFRRQNSTWILYSFVIFSGGDGAAFKRRRIEVVSARSRRSCSVDSSSSLHLVRVACSQWSPIKLRDLPYDIDVWTPILLLNLSSCHWIWRSWFESFLSRSFSCIFLLPVQLPQLLPLVGEKQCRPTQALRNFSFCFRRFFTSYT